MIINIAIWTLQLLGSKRHLHANIHIAVLILSGADVESHVLTQPSPFFTWILWRVVERSQAIQKTPTDSFGVYECPPIGGQLYAHFSLFLLVHPPVKHEIQ